MANVREDVAHLRAQYEEARNQGHAIVILYNDEQIRDGDQLEEHHAAQAPRVEIHVDSDPQKPFFTLVMADPDAPRRGHEVASPWLHWIRTGFTGNEIDRGTTLADYQAPTPPAFTGPHQYIFLLYKSARDNVSFDGGPIPVTTFARRRLFRLEEFENDHQLQLVAATSFTVSG